MEDYLLRLFYSQVNKRHDARAAILLSLLSLYLPTPEIERLRAETLDYPPRKREREIRRLVKEQGIKHLVHFTRADNVRSIFDHGLLPRASLMRRLGDGAGSVKTNDAFRFDNHTDANCLSISFPNYLMLYRYQRMDPTVAWAVLLIKAKVLWERDCAFCRTNASANCMRSASLDELRQSSTLAELFEDYESEAFRVARVDLPIAGRYPTNPQAEVLVFDTIATEEISAVYLPDRDRTFDTYKASWKGIPIRFSRKFFAPRADYKFWKR